MDQYDQVAPTATWDSVEGALIKSSPPTTEAGTTDEKSIVPASIVRLPSAVTVCLFLITIILVLGTLSYTQAVSLPLTLALVLYLVLRPAMLRLRRMQIPAAISAAICLVLPTAIAILIVFHLATPVREFIVDLPAHMVVIQQKMQGLTEQIENVETASEQLEELGDGEKEAEEEPVPVEIQQPRFAPGLAVLNSTGGLAAGLIICFGTLFFMLTHGDLIIRNALLGISSQRTRDRFTRIIDDLQHGISNYLWSVTVINLGLGVATGTAMWVMGMPEPLLIGVMAAFFNYIPFLGAWAGTAIVGIVAVITFDSLGYAALIPITYFMLTSIEGQFITPYILGRTMSLNPLIVFLFIAIWGWIWGIGGVFLAVPLLAILNIVAEYVPMLRYMERAIRTD
ncbi:AI-2E family transporter [Rubinisphaera margarita]|uniref:AI-2E family transporter n=1 Tax=Rubinisphaera margarita TaxID=2909586 RepID=UPI001EE9476E|nr:AI-2E family transporter [Rubinisphaera margarita]MCG6156450.1 AI-2E family transporter [Rubinisphaera margarita]